MGEKCPVCERPVVDGATKCDNCGFEDERGVDREWINTEDANLWWEMTVKPCRTVWKAARKRETSRKREATMAKKREAELLAQLETAGRREAARKREATKAKMREADLLAQLEEAYSLKADVGKPEIIPDVGTSFTDPRDGQTYRTVKICGLVWMAENLNYRTDDSWCYDDDESNEKKYGRLYTWTAARVACPEGWHLPSREEWDELVKAMGGQRVAGKVLKSKTGWESLKRVGTDGTDAFGFSALPGGQRDYFGGGFKNAGYFGYWWGATEYGMDGGAYCRYMVSSYACVRELPIDVRDGLSVRCVANYMHEGA